MLSLSFSWIGLDRICWVITLFLAEVVLSPLYDLSELEPVQTYMSLSRRFNDCDDILILS